VRNTQSSVQLDDLDELLRNLGPPSATHSAPTQHSYGNENRQSVAPVRNTQPPVRNSVIQQQQPIRFLFFFFFSFFSPFSFSILPLCKSSPYPHKIYLVGQLSHNRSTTSQLQERPLPIVVSSHLVVLWTVPIWTTCSGTSTGLPHVGSMAVHPLAVIAHTVASLSLER
jgi:hypothetical protein